MKQIDILVLMVRDRVTLRIMLFPRACIVISPMVTAGGFCERVAMWGLPSPMSTLLEISICMGVA